MKTLFYTTILLINCQLVVSQSLQIYRDGINTTSSTITVNGSASAYELIADRIVVFKTTPTVLNVKLKRYEVSFIPNTYNYVCWGSLCGNPRLAASSEMYIHGAIVVPSDSSRSFTGHYSPEGQTGQSIYRYVFFATNTLDSAYCTVIFNVLATSIKEISNTTNINIYPNIVSSEFMVEFKSTHNLSTTISIYDQLGKLVLTERKNIDINNNKKTTIINTENLVDGFLYSIC